MLSPVPVCGTMATPSSSPWQRLPPLVSLKYTIIVWVFGQQMICWPLRWPVALCLRPLATVHLRGQQIICCPKTQNKVQWWMDRHHIKWTILLLHWVHPSELSILALYWKAHSWHRGLSMYNLKDKKSKLAALDDDDGDRALFECLNRADLAAGRAFQYLMALGKKEYWYDGVPACGWRNLIEWPLMWLPVDTKYSSGGISTSLLWMWYSMMMRALASCVAVGCPTLVRLEWWIRC